MILELVKEHLRTYERIVKTLIREDSAAVSFS